MMNQENRKLTTTKTETDKQWEPPTFAEGAFEMIQIEYSLEIAERVVGQYY